MPKKYVELFGQIANFQALNEAAERAFRGKRSKLGAASFMARREPELLRIERELLDGTWKPGRYVRIDIREPKPRQVSAAPFRDRVVHHAVDAIIGPIFEQGFIADTYANRKGYGTHRAIARYEHYRDRYAHVLRADIYRYFPAIDHAILKQCYRRRGLPIGNLTSQFFANLYLDAFDHFVKEVLRAPDDPPVGRLTRGASWNNKPQNARSANRNRNTTTNRNNNGFRLAST